jgi:hypothetical protein
MPDHLFYFTETPQPVWKRKLRRAGREFSIWYRSLMVSLVEMTILFAATLVIFATVFTFLKALWYCYLQTAVGRKFTAGTTIIKNQTLAEILDKDLIFFSFEIVLASLIACLITSAVCQMSAVRRCFYEGRGLGNRLTWLFLFSSVSAYNLIQTSHFDFPIAFGLCILPSLCLFATCLKVSAKILPELTPLGIQELTRRVLDFVTNPE